MQLALLKAPCAIVAVSKIGTSAKNVPVKHFAGRAIAPVKPIKSIETCLRAATAEASNGAAAAVPEPVVKIDNHTDPFATIVTVEFGDRLGELLDTVNSLKNLGLNIRRAKLTGGVAGAGGEHRFYITDARSSEKVVKSAKIEEIRLTILNNMLQFHPESAEQLAWGSSSARSAPVSTGDPTRPLGRRQRSIQTQIEVRDCESGAFSEILVNTVDRPGLLTDIVSVLKDVSLNVISAEVDTIGKNAVDTFNVTYHGEPLPPAMKELVMNALQYYLSQGDMEKQYSDSY
ncbi:putative ACT domain-containing protein DS12, chloroplastic [Nannochloris sp. 'desiccata']|nr:putative ACT domain-containing protein DS12, chloroplastic [Chlorella desiccata (nom. nud.)]